MFFWKLLFTELFDGKNKINIYLKYNFCIFSKTLNVFIVTCDQFNNVSLLNKSLVFFILLTEVLYTVKNDREVNGKRL